VRAPRVLGVGLTAATFVVAMPLDYLWFAALGKL